MFGPYFVPIELPKIKLHLTERIEENNFDPDEGNTKLCDACMLPIFSTPYQPTGEGHFLHKKTCVDLPPDLIGHSLHPKSLHLHKQHTTHLPNPCDSCTRDCSRGGFFYQCSDDDCKFTLDVVCATTVKIVHRSHPHELAFICRRGNLFTCGACGLEHKGDFYWCVLCNFFLHHECASLPNTILHDEHKEHPLCISYVIPTESFKVRKLDACAICPEKLSSANSGMYFCTRCDYNMHIKCATANTSSFHRVLDEDVVGGLIHLPMPDEQTSLLRCLLKNQSSQRGSSTADTEEGKTISSVHGHKLIFHDKHDDDPSKSTVSSYLCDACIEPISPPFYSCPQCHDFYLHACCADLPWQCQHPGHGLSSTLNCKDKPLSFLPKISRNFFTMFWCTGCFKYCNGSIYWCENCEFSLDVSCALLPEAVTYEGHGKSHVLFLSYTSISTAGRACQCCNNSILQQLFYKCCSCSNFELHALCALLPSTVLHKLDRHPLKLSFSKFPTLLEVEDRDFCEICEKGIDTECWFYHCKECVTLFHIRCIPCVGEYSMIKYGGSIWVRCHGCPLTSIRQLTSHNYTCGRCDTIIEGREADGVAFECTKCCYWLCVDCARREWDRSRHS